MVLTACHHRFTACIFGCKRCLLQNNHSLLSKHISRSLKYSILQELKKESVRLSSLCNVINEIFSKSFTMLKSKFVFFISFS